ncbi:RNA 3'-terminal phosphate cyclase [Salarias fasciatus]|nr:RNA 3'-terminal phosphate cyclase [Salarias fasciatus]
MEPVELDGSVMEGGGQILRVCAALSCITGTPIRVRNIRAGRSTPGLRPQHLCGLQLLSQMTSGLLQGSEVGSTHITLEPRAVGGGAYTADTHTAGSVCLLLQASLPVSLFSNQRTDLVLKGGTETELAPHSDYTLKVFKPIVEKFGVQFDFDVVKRGFYPKGGGVVSVSVQPIRQLQPVVMETRGGVARITGTAFVAGVLPIKLAKAMSAAAARALRAHVAGAHVDVAATNESQSAFGNGSGILLVAETTGGCLLASSALGKRGVSPEQVGVAAAEALLGNLRHGGCVDDFLQDQLVIFMALASGRSRIRTGPPTLHTRTAIHVAEALTKAKFTITKCEDASADANASASDSYLIECDGAGVENTDL